MSELFEAGLTVTAIGMSVVFVLLTMLVGVVRVMSRFSRHIIGDGGSASTFDYEPSTEQEIVGVISAVIRMYRRKRNK